MRGLAESMAESCIDAANHYIVTSIDCIWLWLNNNGTKNGTLVSGNMDQHLRNYCCLILSHTHMLHCVLDLGRCGSPSTLFEVL